MPPQAEKIRGATVYRVYPTPKPLNSGITITFIEMLEMSVVSFTTLPDSQQATGQSEPLRPARKHSFTEKVKHSLCGELIKCDRGLECESQPATMPKNQKRRRKKKVDNYCQWMLGPSLTLVRPMAGAGASTSAAVSNVRVAADPTNPMQSRGITLHWQLNLNMLTPDN